MEQRLLLVVFLVVLYTCAVQGSSTARLCPSGQIYSPSAGTTWQIQYSGTLDTSISVQAFDLDLFDTDQSVIDSLHAKGTAVICYFSTQYEDWRPDAKNFTSAVMGNPLDGWPGEYWVDIRSSIVRNIMTSRLDLAVSKQCDGVDPDNVDEYTNDNGLGITAANQLDFNKFIATQAHARGLAVGLKNDLDQIPDLVTYYEWVVDEQCNQYDECNTLQPFAAANKAVFGIEYTGSVSKFCPKMVAANYSFLLKDEDLTAAVTACCTSYAPHGCVSAPYKCVSSASVPSSSNFTSTDGGDAILTPSSEAVALLPPFFVLFSLFSLLYLF